MRKKERPFVLLVILDIPNEFAVYRRKSKNGILKINKIFGEISEAVRCLITNDTNMTEDPNKLHRFVVKMKVVS